MKTIYKYNLDYAKHQQVSMPSGADILKLGVQDGKPWIWAMVDTEEELVPHEFLMFCTGEELDPFIYRTHRYLDTVLVDGFVFHFFTTKLGQ